MKAHMGEGKKIKAAGGISGFADAEKFLSLGVDRLGTSRLVEQAKKEADSDGQI
jgi:Deoxyribose-phosphate aldolase